MWSVKDHGGDHTGLDFRDSETVFLAAIGDMDNCSRNGIYKSTDSGLSWWPKSVGLPTDLLGVCSVHSTTAAKDNQIVYAGTFRGPYKSTDSGGVLDTDTVNFHLGAFPDRRQSARLQKPVHH